MYMVLPLIHIPMYVIILITCSMLLKYNHSTKIRKKLLILAFVAEIIAITITVITMICGIKSNFPGHYFDEMDNYYASTVYGVDALHILWHPRLDTIFTYIFLLHCIIYQISFAKPIRNFTKAIKVRKVAFILAFIPEIAVIYASIFVIICGITKYFPNHLSNYSDALNTVYGIKAFCILWYPRLDTILIVIFLLHCIIYQVWFLKQNKNNQNSNLEQEDVPTEELTEK